MKFKLLILLLLSSCASKPKYRVGDCVNISVMTITKSGEWNSSGYYFGRIKILDIIKTDKMNKYMAERLHAFEFYKIKVLEEGNEYAKKTEFVIPIKDLDGLRYSDVGWQSPEYNVDKCNDYSNEIKND